MRIYLIENVVNGKRYVGKTKRTVKERFEQHVRDSVRSDLPLHLAIKKYGCDQFAVSVLEECYDNDHANERERHWIAEYNTCHGQGYNATEGGDGVVGYVWSEEMRKKHGERYKGEKNPNWGKPMPDHVKDKIKAKVRGFKHTEDAKKRINDAKLKKVIQFDLDGNEVARYSSMIEAEQMTGVGRQGISRCCREPHRTAKGFKFKYAEEQKAQ